MKADELDWLRKEDPAKAMGVMLAELMIMTCEKGDDIYDMIVRKLKKDGWKEPK